MLIYVAGELSKIRYFFVWAFKGAKFDFNHHAGA